MKFLFGAEVVVGMLFLRLVVPLIITAVLAHSLHRLDVRWQAHQLGR